MLSLYRGRWVEPREAPELHDVLAKLARRAGLRWVLRLFYIPSRVMNAFATGGPDDVVAVSAGVLHGLRPREPAAVLAQEVSHIANGYGPPSSPLHRPGRTPGPARPGTRLGATPAPPGALVLSPRTRRGYPAAHPSGRLRISR